MPKSGCPGANGFQWQEGYIYQDLEDEGNVTTVSPNSQLKGRVSGDIERYFCIKDNIWVLTKCEAARRARHRARRARHARHTKNKKN